MAHDDLTERVRVSHSTNEFPKHSMYTMDHCRDTAVTSPRVGRPSKMDERTKEKNMSSETCINIIGATGISGVYWSRPACENNLLYSLYA